MLALPAEIKKFLQRAARGELEMRFRGIDDHARLVYALGHQIIYAALGITSGAFAMMFDGRAQPHAARYAWYAAGAFASLLSLSILTTRSKLKRRRN